MGAPTLANQRVEQAVRALRSQGERITTARRELLQVFAASDDHLSADDIVERLATSAPSVHRATVYRTLDSLVRAGVVAHMHRPHGPATYHLADGDGRPHLHLACNKCGAVVDAAADLLDDVARRVKQSTGFVLDADHVALTGECRACGRG
jgi:Fur family transcriptional regulator, ferric uptake regulator